MATGEATVVRLAMTASGVMLAYQVASKAVRDAVFLGAWPATSLPAVVITAAAVAIGTVPIFSHLLARFGPRAVVPLGFLASAAGHLVEWTLSARHPWVAVAIYLHIAGVGALLLSGFWSLVSELFDPQTAKRTYARIAGAGTLGGIAGGVAAERIAALFDADAALLLLAGAHVACAAGIFLLAANTTGFASATRANPIFERGSLRAAPHLRALAAIVVIGTASAAIVDYLFKARAATRFGSSADLLQFFAIFYAASQVATFAAQTRVTRVVERFGLGRTVSALPGGLAAGSVLALLFPVFPMFLVARAAELVLRGSFFRSGYELVFAPMDPDEKRRVKTFLDVACDRAGDGIGAAVVQVLLLAAPAFLVSELLAVVVALSAVSLWVAARLDAMYVGVLQRRLVHAGGPPTMIGSEPIWTVLDTPRMPPRELQAAPPASRVQDAGPIRAELDPSIRTLADLRSGSRPRVEAALRVLREVDAVHAAQVVQLLAWDEVLPDARRVLERVADRHVGLLVDALTDPETDFAIRRRVPRVIATVHAQRAFNGLVWGLDDGRFEVRYQCSRGMDRMLTRFGDLSVDRDRVLEVVNRELSVERGVWNAYRLLDQPDAEEGPMPERHAGLHHAFLLLAAVYPRDPVLVALRGLTTDDRDLRALAIEFLDSVLPAGIRDKLWTLIAEQT